MEKMEVIQRHKFEEHADDVLSVSMSVSLLRTALQAEAEGNFEGAAETALGLCRLIEDKLLQVANGLYAFLREGSGEDAAEKSISLDEHRSGDNGRDGPA